MTHTKICIQHYQLEYYFVIHQHHESNNLLQNSSVSALSKNYKKYKKYNANVLIYIQCTYVDICKLYHTLICEKKNEYPIVLFGRKCLNCYHYSP